MGAASRRVALTDLVDAEIPTQAGVCVGRRGAQAVPVWYRSLDAVMSVA